MKRFWEVDITPLQAGVSPTRTTRLRLSFSPQEEELAREELLDGTYVLTTSVDPQDMDAETVASSYRSLHLAERGFRHIKSFLKIRPVYHRLRRRIRAHVLICFFAYYLVKNLELTLREGGDTREVEEVVRYWEKLRLSEHHLQAEGYESTAWNWQLGEVGLSIKQQMSDLKIWHSVDTYRRSLLKQAS